MVGISGLKESTTIRGLPAMRRSFDRTANHLSLTTLLLGERAKPGCPDLFPYSTMTTRIQVRHEAASERIQKYITTEFDHIIQRFNESADTRPYVISAEFIVDQEGSNGHLKTFEAIVKVPGDTLTVKERDPEAHKAVDAAMKVLEKLLKRHKETYLKPGNLIRHQADRAAGAGQI